MSKLAMVAAILPAAAWWWTNPLLLRLQYLNQVAYALYHPGACTVELTALGVVFA